MNNKKIIAAVGVVLALGVLAALFLKPRTDTVKVTSADGKLEIEIPSKLLPKDVERKSVSITAVDGKAFFGTEGETPGPAYELLPDGLAFSEPVTLRYRGEAGVAGVAPLMLHVASENDMEFAPPAKFSVDEEKKTVVSEFPITHFSRVGFDSLHGVFAYELTSGGKADVGSTLPFLLTITPRDNIFWYDKGYGYAPEAPKFSQEYNEKRTGVGFYYYMEPGSKYTVPPFVIEHSLGNSLEPKSVSIAGQTLEKDQQYRAEATWTCARPGMSRLDFYGVDILYRFTSETRSWDDSVKRYVTKKNTYDKTTSIAVSTEDHECAVGPSATTTGTGADSENAAVDGSTNAPKFEGKIKVCGLPGGEPCPKR